MTGHIRKEDIAKDLIITGISTAIKTVKMRRSFRKND